MNMTSIWEISPNETETIIIELIMTLIMLLTIVELVIIKRKYKKLTQKGYPLLLAGVSIFGLHFLCDFLDTLARKEVNGEQTLLYLIFDYLDAIFSFVGLIAIGFGFYRIAKYGMDIWEAPTQ